MNLSLQVYHALFKGGARVFLSFFLLIIFKESNCHTKSINF